MDANYPEMVLALCALILGAAERVRHERLEVIPSRVARTLELDGDRLLVPTFSYLNGELLDAAVTRGLRDLRIEAYLDSFIRFASAYLEEPDFIEPLRSSGGYETTESEVLRSFPTHGTSLTRDQGLSLVRESCHRMEEQVSSLRQKHEQTPPGNELDPEVGRVIHIGDSPAVLAEGAHPERGDDEQATVRAANKEPA